ncbi:MAG: hypothetical protein KGS72_06120 [Cyanobacteria bacterium REEB67]|nr:hypothetical protein [Cyanobacteria bacterium REEB67]
MSLVKRLGNCVFHPFLLAAVSVLSARLQVKLEVLPEEVLAPLALMEAWAALVFLVFWAILKNAQKAGIVSSFVVGLSLCFDQFRLYVNLGWQLLFHQPLEDIVVFFLFWIVLGALLFPLLRSAPPTKGDQVAAGCEEGPKGPDFARMTVAFNIMCTLLLLLNVVPLAVSDFESMNIQKRFLKIFAAPFAPVNPVPVDGQKPDVYYIILDAYASPNTLENQGKFDDHEFIDFLKKHGFYVVPRAAANYDRTPFSISSSLNMDYIQAVPKEMGDNYVADNIYYRLIQYNAVADLFKKMGYKFVNVSSGAFATDYIWGADVNVKNDFGSHFTTAMMLLTPLTGLEKYLHIMRDNYCDRRLAPGKALPAVLSVKGPKFVLIHTDLSHPPSLFTKEGKRLDLPRELLNDHSTDFAAYADQIKFCNSQVEQWVEKIDGAYQKKPVIIIQADHGPYYPLKSDDAYYNEVMRILNAYRFPDNKAVALYPTITPVNSFRVLFNGLFGTRLPLLKDQSWCSPVRVRPYSWSDVTPRLIFPLAEHESSTRPQTDKAP